jgi:ribosome-binding protein aMBF1 (putative translation factor)
MNLGKCIAELRKENGWWQSDFAKQTDISQIMVGKYVRGDAIPSIEISKKLQTPLGFR